MSKDEMALCCLLIGSDSDREEVQVKTEREGGKEVNEGDGLCITRQVRCSAPAGCPVPSLLDAQMLGPFSTR